MFSKPGWLPTPHLAQVYVAPTLAVPYAALPPFGMFHLDPATTVTLPALVLPAPAGKVTARVLLPQDPSLIGQPFHAQAWIVDPTTGIGGFSNRITVIVGS